MAQHLGLSNVSPKQFDEARPIAKIVCVQNYYYVAIERTTASSTASMPKEWSMCPSSPLGGFSPFQSSALDEAAATLHTTPMVVALAWLLQRSPNILLISGTSSVAHQRENLSAASTQLSPDVSQSLND